MAECWADLFGDEEPKSAEDLKKAFDQIDKAGLIEFKNKTFRNKLAREFFMAMDGDSLRVIDTLDRALEKGKFKAEAYLKGCLPKEEHDAQKPELAKTEKTTTPPAAKVVKSAENGNQVKLENYVFLHRKIRHHPYFKDKNKLIKMLFVDLILDAAFKDHETEWRNVKIFLKRGQWIVSFRELAEEYQVDDRTIRRWVKDLKNKKMIGAEVVCIRNCRGAAPPAAPCAAPCAAPKEKVGILVTITNYDKWQPNTGIGIKDGAAPLAAPPAAPPAAQQKNVINTEEGKAKQCDLGGDPPEPINSTEVYRIWDENRGPLDAVTARSSKSAHELVKTLNDLHSTRDPRDVWSEVVQKASRCHKSHRDFMTFGFFSKDPNRINQVLDGMYDKTFSGGFDGKRKTTGASLANIEHFGEKDED